MADNVTITAGSGTTIATDDNGGTHHQVIKVMLGANSTFTGQVGGEARGSDYAMYVDNRPKVAVVQVASAGLTTSTTAYSANDQLGTILTFANAVRASGGTATIRSATLVDKAKIVGAIDLYLFNQSVTLASDNAAADFSDSDMLFCCGIIRFPAPQTVTSNGFTQVESSGLAITCSGSTSLYGALVTRSGHTFFGAVGDLVTTLTLELD